MRRRRRARPLPRPRRASVSRGALLAVERLRRSRERVVERLDRVAGGLRIENEPRSVALVLDLDPELVREIPVVPEEVDDDSIVLAVREVISSGQHFLSSSCGSVKTTIGKRRKRQKAVARVQRLAVSSICVNSAIQFTSQLDPSSKENDCSQVELSDPVPCQVYRTRSGTPSTTSSHSKIPTPSTNRP